MSDDNGSSEERKKQCPFSSKWCSDSCALMVEMAMRNHIGVPVVQKMCVFVASNLMLSEINMKTHPLAQKVQLPDLIKRG